MHHNALWSEEVLILEICQRHVMPGVLPAMIEQQIAQSFINKLIVLSTSIAQSIG